MAREDGGGLKPEAEASGAGAAGESEAGYDFIIVGAGSSGCVIARRLAERTDASVLLVEAGGPDVDPRIHSTTMANVMSLWGPGETDWGYVSSPQPGLEGRQIAIARGRVWGGCSSINALLYVRGNARDYDGWAELGAKGWDHASVLPYFRRSENFDGGASEYRGTDGPLNVTGGHRETTPVAEALFDTGVEYGLRDGREGGYDYNAGEQADTVFYYQATKNPDGTRCSTAGAFLHPVLGLPNLTVLDRAQVTRVLLTSGRASGIEYVRDGRRGLIRADREVVLSAGAFGSPHLLMLSGLGPAEHLLGHGVAVAADLPGVGADLQDHVLLSNVYLSTDEQAEPGALIAETGFFLRSGAQAADESPGLQMMFGGLKFVAPNLDREGSGFTFAPVLTQPHSRGSVRLAGPEATTPAVVDPGYLSDPRDVEDFLEALEMSREMAATRAMRAYTKTEIAPGPQVRDRAALVDYIRGYAGTLWHPVGTCRMGAESDETAVVDPRLRVRGVVGLRVADGSVMPRIVAGNTNAACIMIGEKAADLIIEDNGTPAKRG